eukprot:COSAG06_NODE_65_length_26676_cov_11.671107_1_plen_93_part_00
MRFGIKGPANGTEWLVSVDGVPHATVVPNYFVEVPIGSADFSLLTPTVGDLDHTPQRLGIMFDCVGDLLPCGGEEDSSMTFVSVVSTIFEPV